MSLKPCPDCRAPVSPSALACPKCGRNLAAYRSHWWALAILATMLAAIAFSLSDPAHAQQIYRCADESGRVAFSQQACPDGTAGDGISAHNPPPSNGADSIPWGDVTVLPRQERTQRQVTVVGAPKWCGPATDQEIRSAIIHNKIFVGMTAEQAVKSWGRPFRINRSSHGPDQWVYGRKYLYIEDGCVVSWN